jgi:hypothetical protein
MMKSLHTEIEINAAPEKVWSLLTDFSNISNWNPFMEKAVGKIEKGQEIEVLLHPPGGKAMTFKPTLIKVEENKELRWLGHLFFKGLFDGEHYFKIEPLGENRVRFVQGEEFKGILVPLLMGMIGDNTRLGFESMNKALKIEAEK